MSAGRFFGADCVQWMSPASEMNTAYVTLHAVHVMRKWGETLQFCDNYIILHADVKTGEPFLFYDSFASVTWISCASENLLYLHTVRVPAGDLYGH